MENAILKKEERRREMVEKINGIKWVCDGDKNVY